MRVAGLKAIASCSLVVLAAACGGPSGATSDAGQSTTHDAPSVHETGAVDGGKSRDATTADARLPDARLPDANTLDSPGRPPNEAAIDAGPPGPIVPAAACTGTPADVYGVVPNLPPMTNALRGDIVACTSDGTVDVAGVQSQLMTQGDLDVAAVSAVAIYRVQYRTTRANGADGVSSARIYLPVSPLTSTPPLVIAAHGTEGLAASCATSMDATSMRDLALPWATTGYPVIAPDYAGLGTAGVQGYTDNHDTARSVVDSVAALRKFVSETLSQQVVIDGHSQGGGAALATQALAKSMGMQGDLVAVLAFAPEYYSHLDSLGFMGALESVAESNPLTISTGVTKCEVAALIEYAYFANYVPGGPPTAGFPAAYATNLQTAIESECTVPLGGSIQIDAPHVNDWTDPTLRAELIACIAASDAGVGHVPDGSVPDGGAACTGAGQAFYQYLEQNIIPPDATGAPILLVQGLQDIVMPPDQEAACNLIQLEAGGVTPQVCTDATASHTTVVQRNIQFGMQWAHAVLAGTTPPPCAASALPACDQP
jgi:pimeloyl-ACP methyl ester carboxylesterase